MPNLAYTMPGIPLSQRNNIQQRDKTYKKDGASGSEAYRKKIGLLCRVGEKVNKGTELPKLLYQILRMSQKTLQVSASSILLLDKDSNELYFKASERQAGKILKPVRFSIDSGIAGWVARNAKPVLSNDVFADPRFNKDIDKLTGFVTKSVLAVPIGSGSEVIGVIEVLNKNDGTKFNKQDLDVLMAVASMATVAINNSKLHQDVLDAYRSTTNALAAAIDAKDPYTCGHSQRVMEYTLLAASSFRFSPEELLAIEFASLLHDVGKIGIDTTILRKADHLSNSEWQMMRKHPLIGANIIGAAPYMQRVRDLVLRHHETYDGRGYPDGLKGREIPLGSRLIAVTDAFDTMTTNRSYRSPVTINVALNEITRQAGTQFCPLAVKAFTTNFLKYREMLAYKM